MLLLTCPYCGVTAEETEFAPGGAAHLTRAGPGEGDDALEAYLFHRANPKGVHFERWRHAYGCGKWFLVARATVTMDVVVYVALRATRWPLRCWPPTRCSWAGPSSITAPGASSPAAMRSPTR